jgi:hypothetical protein
VSGREGLAPGAAELAGGDRRVLAYLESGDPEAAPLASAVPAGDRAGVRPLTDGERAAVTGVAAAVAGVALIGFANSFAAVMTAAWPSFGRLAPTVPLGIDLGIAIFAGLDLVLARLDMRLRWVRLVPWALTAATVYLNVAGQHTMFGRIAHGVFPALWVLAVEAGAHVIRVRARLAGGKAMDRIRVSRWLLAPLRTAGLWRRMVLWEVRSYPLALSRERARILARTGLQDAYGGLSWRWRAPRRARALYRLGELTPDALAASGAAGDDGGPDADRDALHSGLNGHAAAAAEMFGADVAAGRVPGLRAIQSGMRIGQPRAQQVQAYLRGLAEGPGGPA